MNVLIRKSLLSAICFVCLFSVFSGILPAQQFNIQTFTTKDGLSHNNVRAMAVDSLGFLWIATWDGLSRFDGYSFKNYYHKNDDSLSLPFFSIYNVLVDGANNLWLMTDDKLVVKYNRNHDTFKQVNHIYKSLPEFYSSISLDESGYIWLINSDSIFRFDYKKNVIDRYELCDPSGSPKKILDNLYYTISTSENNKVWLIYDKIYQFEKSNGNKLILSEEYSLVRKNQLKDYDFHYTFWYSLYSSDSGNKWIFSNSGLFLLDKKSGKFREFRDSFPVNDFKGDGYLFWAWAEDGIHLYDQKETKLFHIPIELCQMVKGIMFQNKNLIWFSNNTMTGSSLGLNKVVFTPGYFKNYALNQKENDIPAVYAISRDKFNNIWLGMRGRNPLIRIGPDLKVTNISVPPDYEKFNHGAIRSLNINPDGIWIGYYKDLLLFYNFHSGEFRRYTIPESILFRPVMPDKEGNLYMSDTTSSSMIRFSPVTQKTEKKIYFTPKSPIYKIVIDSEETVWAGLNSTRLLRYNPKMEESEIYIVSEDNYNVEDICQGDNGDMWLALLGGGVCQFNPETGRKVFYTTSVGLTNNMTYSILKDKTGNIWVSTNAGISRINPATGIIRTFGPNEGLIINEFNSGASYKDDGEFFMGGMGGVVSFFPDSINNEKIRNTDQRIIISEIGVSGMTKHFKRWAAKPDTVLLNKGENNIHILFSSSDFINSDETHYRYKLSKINPDWIETDSKNRSINYANLEPGWYNLQLQATDPNGFWNATKEIKIRIKPFYYETLLFRIAIPSTFLILITCLILIYIKQLKQKADHKQNVLRLQSLQGQMNPHFIFNSLNSINYFISKNDALSANRYIADFSKLIRSILYNFNSEFISLEKEIESLEDYLKIEHLRFGDKFNYKILINSDIAPGHFKVSPGLVQPFVENAIWHGVRGLDSGKGNVVITFAVENEKLICTVEDDGIGRKKAETAKSKIDQKKSRGIFLVTERLNIINMLQKSKYQVIISDIYPEKQETGTKVIINIPVKKN